MKLKCLQVKNFRCIEDSTEFSVCPVTCLVGKNGAGKTSLLDALYKLNPDVAQLAHFDVLMEYPRSRRREYQRRAEGRPDDALIATWELEDEDVREIENALGPGAVKSRAVVVRKGYYPGRKWTGAIGEESRTPAPSQEGPGTRRQAHGEESVPTPDEEAPTLEQIEPAQPETSPESRPPASAGPAVQETEEQQGSVDNSLYELHVGKRLPKMLYFSEWNIMQGRISVDAILQRKQKGELTGPDRVFLALLELGDTSVEELTSIERSEELIADLEDAARPITAQIAKYWSQERDLRISFHLYPGRPQDPAPFDRGMVFETRILNTKTNLSLNFDERSTGFVWFFSFLVWYSDVRRRFGDNLLILLDDPGIGLHAKAQWDLLKYVYDNLAPYYQILYATHSPFMIDPDRMSWVRTVEERVEAMPDGVHTFRGTKVGEGVLSGDYDTLLPLQASLSYRIVRDLDGQKNLLLVERPEDVIYLRWFSARLHEKGRTGLSEQWTLIPCGELTRLATLVGLLVHDSTRYAALISVSAQDPDVTRSDQAMVLDRSHVLPLRSYAEPVESTMEDLLGPTTYLALVDQCYGVSRKQRVSRELQVPADSPVLQAVRNHFETHRPGTGKFDSMLPADCLLTAGSRKLHKLPGLAEALSRFEKLFGDLNARLAGESQTMHQPSQGTQPIPISTVHKPGAIGAPKSTTVTPPSRQ